MQASCETRSLDYVKTSWLVDLQEADCDCGPARGRGRRGGVCPCRTWRPDARAATLELNNLKDPETSALYMRQIFDPNRQLRACADRLSQAFQVR